MISFGRDDVLGEGGGARVSLYGYQIVILFGFLNLQFRVSLLRVNFHLIYIRL